MWPWIKRWRDWAIRELWPMYRTSPQPQTLRYSYEKAGLIINDQPIPWSAEAVQVEAMVRLPPHASRRKADYQLRLPGAEPVSAEGLERQEGERYRLWFRIPPPGTTVAVELRHRDYTFGQLTLPFLSREAFLHGLQLGLPTVFALIGSESVACQSFVSSQCRGLLASGMLRAPTSLVPLLDLDLRVTFSCERAGVTTSTPVPLTAAQLTSSQALVTVTPRRLPRRIGTWTVSWRLGDIPLVTQKVRAVSQAAFQRSLRLCDTRYVVQTQEEVELTRQVPLLAQGARLGPCFLISSGETGMAGLCKVQVTAQVPGAVRPPLLLEEELLVTDAPTMVAPGTLDPESLAEVSGFELKVRGRSLGLLSMRPAPTARFTGEGGFQECDEYSWSSAAEEEMNDRLTRLMEQTRASDEKS